MKYATCLTMIVLAAGAQANTFHVSANGNDTNEGAENAPLRTIQHAADLAQPGDVITVHEGVYRERVSPPRGGTSQTTRITYQAAPGEKVVITGSEPIKGWEKVAGDTWKVTVPNTLFGKFNPYADLIRGDWFDANGRTHHTGCVYLNGDWFIEAASFDDVMKPSGKTPLWFATVTDTTEIYAQFPGVNPNEANVEINVRQTVFTPEKTGVDFLTVRGFHLCNAATNWAPPTAGQIGIISAYWCKGWIIENNEISYSKCSGVALGKYGDEWDNRSESAEGYVGTLKRALANGWNKATVGSHLVRNNNIHHCEQTGIVGSLGCAFSTVTGNEIHDIHTHALFKGMEMCGIKFHGAIDVVISNNHIYRCGESGGIWLDWMAQGAQITGNLLHDNYQDVFCEMQHGPILIANNVFLSSKRSFEIASQGLAIVHNLIVGPVVNLRNDTRETPFHKSHATELAGMHTNSIANDSGDHRFYNNIFVAPCNLSVLDNSALPCFNAGNVFTQGTQPSKFDTGAQVATTFDASIKLEEKSDGWYLTLTEDKAWREEAKCKLVTTGLLGKAKVSDCAYENPDGSLLRVDTDYFGHQRNEENPFPGPFEMNEVSKQTFKVWSKP
jgi:alpha-N-arabinofuranosidase